MFGNFNCGFEFEDSSSASLSYIQTNSPGLPKELIEIHTGGKTYFIQDFQTVSGFSSKAKGKGHREELDFLFKQPNLAAKLSSSLDMLESHKISLNLFSSVQEH